MRRLPTFSLPAQSDTMNVMSLRTSRPRANLSFDERRDLVDLPVDMKYDGSLTTDASQQVADYAATRDTAAPYLSGSDSRRR